MEPDIRYYEDSGGDKSEDSNHASSVRKMNKFECNMGTLLQLPQKLHEYLSLDP